MQLLIIGPQASGKGTQADLIAKRLSIPHLSAGELLREEVKTGSDLGKKIKGIIDQGILVPDKIVWKMLHHHLKQHPEGWILDGFPRNREQAKLLDKHAPPDEVILLEVPDEICVERIAGRRICSTCGKDYHVKYKPSKREGTCDIDGSQLIQRTDDYPEAVRQRLAAYHTQTEPLIRHYGTKVVRINGNQGIEEVWAEIQRHARV
jgi:adenylate kinase